MLYWLGRLFYKYVLKPIPPLARWWDARRPLSKKIVINLVIGLGIMMVIIYFENWPWMIEAQDASMDWMMELNQKIIPAREEKDIPAFVLIDIDDKTFHRWGEPLFTPRNYLKNMIERSIAAEPRLVLVDVDVSQSTPMVDKSLINPDEQMIKNYVAEYGADCLEKNDQSCPPLLHPNDQALKDYLEHYVTECENKADGLSCTPILLARVFQTQFNEEDESYPLPRTGFLEEVVARAAKMNNPPLQWASVHFFHAKDQTVRRWKLWEPACYQQGSELIPTVVPSFELAVMANIQKGCSLAKMHEALTPFRPKNCEQVIEEHEQPEKVTICRLTTSTDIRNINQRVNYKMPWSESPAHNGLGESPPHIETQADERVLTIFSAEHFATPSSQVTEENLNQLKGSIVVIGGSYREARDIHLTPLEEMPGALIIINAIHSLLTLDEGTIQPLSLPYRLSILAILIVLITYVVKEANSIWGMLGSGLIVIILLLIPAISLYRNGIWMDYTIPLIVVQFYQIINNFEQIRQLQIRSVNKP